MEDRIAAAGGHIDQPEQKYNILALFGKAGSGKDTIKNTMLEKFAATYHGIVSYTSRPPRNNEVDGKDYHFVTVDEFATHILNFSMLEATCFDAHGGPWFYGTNIHSLDINKINIGVFNITAIECLLGDPRLNVIPVMIYATDKKRLQRQLEREQDPDCYEICRRFISDEKDFDDVPFEYMTVINTDDYLLINIVDALNIYGQNSSIFLK